MNLHARQTAPSQAIAWRFPLALLGALIGALLALELAIADVSAQDLQAAPNPTEQTIEIGTNGNLRLGRWSPLRVTGTPDNMPTRFEVRTVDGDDFGITYQGTLSIDPERPGMAHGWFRLGRKVNSLQVKLFRNEKDFSTDEIPINTIRVVKSTQPISISIADEVSATAFAVTVQGSDDTRNKIVVPISDLASLPIDRLGYDSVESIFMVANNPDQIAQLTAMQVNAIEQWIENGGKLILSVPADSANLIGAGAILERFSPGKYVSASKFSNSRSLEGFVASREQLIPKNGKPIALAKIELTAQTVADNDATKLVTVGADPLIVRRAKGAGEIVFAAFDLGDEQIAQWGSYADLVRILSDGVDKNEIGSAEKSVKRSGSISHYGYTDLAGQLRVPLDRFSNVGFVAFTLIASLIVVYILLIGPVDYFILRRLFGKRMELTWVTFPIYSLLFCGLAYFISGWSRPQEIQVNQLEIIDIDLESGRTRGTVWSNVYSPAGQSLDVSLSKTHQLGFSIDNESISWSGLPGDGLGGMLTRPNPSGPTQSYQQSIDLDDDGNFHIAINQLPVQVSSSRAFIGQWSGDVAIDVRTRPRYRPQVASIRGSVKNPFDFELKNCRLFFRDWAYILPQPLGPGQTLDIESGMDEKKVNGVLRQRAKTRDQKNEYKKNSVWNPAEKRVNRIADMLMFHDAAEGKNYTGFTHGYYSHVDLSEHLNLDRAILVGEVKRPGAEILLNEGKVKTENDQVTTIVRLIFPISNQSNARN